MPCLRLWDPTQVWRRRIEVIRLRLIFPFCAATSLLCLAQTAEVTTKDSPVTFTSGTNLVPVTVVVRDGGGHAVGNLRLDDFQLFDNGKPQMISKFSVEKLAKDPEVTQQKPSPNPAAPGAVPAINQLNWLSLREFCWKGTRDLLKSFGWGIRHSVDV